MAHFYLSGPVKEAAKKSTSTSDLTTKRGGGKGQTTKEKYIFLNSKNFFFKVPMTAKLTPFCDFFVCFYLLCH